MCLVGGGSVAMTGSHTAMTVIGVGNFSSISSSAAEPVSQAAHPDEKKMIARGRSAPALNVSFNEGSVSRVRLRGALSLEPLVLHAARASTTSDLTKLAARVRCCNMRSLPAPPVRSFPRELHN